MANLYSFRKAIAVMFNNSIQKQELPCTKDQAKILKLSKAHSIVFKVPEANSKAVSNMNDVFPIIFSY